MYHYVSIEFYSFRRRNMKHLYCTKRVVKHEILVSVFYGLILLEM